MGVDVRCPACHAHTRIPDDALGRNIRCKKCNRPFLAKSAQGIPKPNLQKIPRNRLLLYVLTAVFVLLVVLLITLRLTGVI